MAHRLGAASHISELVGHASTTRRTISLAGVINQPAPGGELVYLEPYSC